MQPATRARSGLRTALPLVAGLGAAILVCLAIYFGSGRLTRFDSPLAAYAAATVFSAFAITFRYTAWLQRPPTWQYFKTSWNIFLRLPDLPRNLVRLAGLLWNNLIAQRFIERRSPQRWMAHLMLAWGCFLAFAITFPLSWGWIQFGVAEDSRTYVVETFGIPTLSFTPNSVLAFLLFNGLNISAVLVLGGVALAMHRRIFHSGAHAVQTLANDFVPLFILFSVSVTGLMLTASYKWMGGSHFAFLSLLHAFTVIVFLLWIPFGKFFHIIQRPAQLGVAFYKEQGAKGEAFHCARTGEAFQSKLHHDDLVSVMKELGIDFGAHQGLSPTEKRRLVALNQAALIDGAPFVG